MSKQLDAIVYIGRFQPFHNGHLQTLKAALEKTDEVIILLGSSNRAQNIRNPWNAQQRESMIREVLKDEGIAQKHVSIVPINDHPYNNDAWLEEVQAKVNARLRARKNERPDDYKPKVGIVGFKRDHTSFYLDLFPQWESVEIEEFGKINATEIRNVFFETTGYFNSHVLNDAVKKDIPRAALAWVEEFFANEREFGDRLRAEYQHVQKYKKAWENAPYMPSFLTCDAVVTQAGHILLVRRGAMPGEGLWALPGGFVNHNERIFDAAVRELQEETKIKVPEKILRKSMVKKDYFDDPDRSLRGRTVTFGFHFALDAVPDGLPKVKGSDDAVKAIWVPFAEFKEMETQMFEDHFAIATTLIGNL